MSITISAEQAWRDYSTDGESSSGAHPPIKVDIRTWGQEIEQREFDTRTLFAADTMLAGVDIVRTGGYTTAGDGGGATYMRGDQPSHDFKVQSADGAWWEGIDALMTPEMFGAVGNGSTDDLVALQSLFDCPVSKTILLGAGKTYYYETAGSVDNLTISRTVHLYTNGSTLHHNATGGSSNHALSIVTPRTDEETWTETISAYATVITITTSLVAGDRILLWLGEHPTDSTVGHAFIWATITANSGTTITINKPVPYDINGTSHKLYPATINEGTFIDVLRFVQEGATNTVLKLQSIRDFHLNSLIIKDGTQGLGLADGCENINIGSISGNGREGAGPSTSGRVISSWACKTVRIGTIDWVHTDNGTVAAIFEGGMQDIHIGQFNLKRVLALAATSTCVKVTGGSQLKIGRFTLTSNQNDRIPAVGSSGENSLSIDDLVVNAPGMEGATLLSVVHAENLHFNGVSYIDRVQLHKRIYINELHSANVLEWFWGVPRRVYARIGDTTEVNTIVVRYEDDTNGSFLSTLTSGEWTDVGSNVSFKAALDKGRRFRLSIVGLANKETLLETWVEYWIDPAVTELSNLSPWDENRGEVTDTTDGPNGDIAISHGLGQIPRTIHVQMQGSTDYTTIIQAKTKTTFTVRVFDSAGVAKTSTSVTVSWSALV